MIVSLDANSALFYFRFFLFLYAFSVGGLGFEFFCMFVAVVGMLFGLNDLLLLLLLLSLLLLSLDAESGCFISDPVLAFTLPPPPPVRSYNLFALERLSADVSALRAFAARCPVANLAGELEEPCQLCTLLLSGQVCARGG